MRFCVGLGYIIRVRIPSPSHGFTGVDVEDRKDVIEDDKTGAVLLKDKSKEVKGETTESITTSSLRCPDIDRSRRAFLFQLIPEAMSDTSS
jgi:hypothetical protein